MGLVGQVQNLIASIQGIITNLPTYIETLSGMVFQIGPFRLDMTGAIKDLAISFTEPRLR